MKNEEKIAYNEGLQDAADICRGQGWERLARLILKKKKKVARPTPAPEFIEIKEFSDIILT